jgi:hypothetical protein
MMFLPLVAVMWTSTRDPPSQRFTTRIWIIKMVVNLERLHKTYKGLPDFDFTTLLDEWINMIVKSTENRQHFRSFNFSSNTWSLIFTAMISCFPISSASA